MPTRTGSFPIGFRQGWTSWFKDLPGLLAWAAKSNFEAIDLGSATPADIAKVQDAGLRIGTVDLVDFGKLMVTDPGKRKDLIDRNVAHITALSAVGVKAFFACMLPEDPTAKRAENYRHAVDAFAPLCEAAYAAGSRLAVEGYPGGPPHYGALCTTPETVRALLKDLPPGFALNFDPSHLVRLGVDPYRFAKEFAPHFAHAHGKDTEVFDEAVYEYGRYQPAVFSKPRGFGEHVWRYTIPGHGATPWSSCFKVMQEAGFTGAVCIELEDDQFNGTEAGEKEALLYGQNFLRGA
jgi:sugar phosphate isomerase/epimerase